MSSRFKVQKCRLARFQSPTIPHYINAEKCPMPRTTVILAFTLYIDILRVIYAAYIILHASRPPCHFILYAISSAYAPLHDARRHMFQAVFPLPPPARSALAAPSQLLDDDRWAFVGRFWWFMGLIGKRWQCALQSAISFWYHFVITPPHKNAYLLRFTQFPLLLNGIIES